MTYPVMSLSVIGCAGSIPRPDSAASCYLVTAADAALVMDLGNGALGPLLNAVDPTAISAIAITHAHPDHWADLTALCVLLRHGPSRRSPIPVYAPAGLSSRIAAAYNGDQSHDLSDVFQFVALRNAQAFDVGSLRVLPGEVAHPGPAFGFRVECGERVLVYSGDTDECEGLVSLSRGAHLALFEAAFVDPEPGDPPLPHGLHMTGSMAGRVARRAGVTTLMLTHTVAWNATTRGHERELLAARGEFSGSVLMAAPGVTLHV